MNAAAKLSEKDIFEKFPDLKGRYSLDRAIGEASGFGAVWQATDNWIGSSVAIKLSQHNLSEEVRLCREVDGDTARVFDFYKGSDGWQAYTMEHLQQPWRTLSTLIETRRYKKADIQFYLDSFEILYAVLGGLQSLHGARYQRGSRVIHADVKPANIFLLYKKKARPHSVFRMPAAADMIKIIDLGVSTYHGGAPLGYTADYRPPNMLSVGPGFDLYALAVSFIELLTGQLPAHEDLANPSTIRKAIARRSSGSVYLDELAVEVVRRCKNAVTQKAQTAEKVMAHLDAKLFNRDPLSLICLRRLVQRNIAAGSQNDIVEAIYPLIAQHWGWKKSSAKRKDTTAEFVAMLLSDGLIEKHPLTKRLIVANGAN